MSATLPPATSPVPRASSPQKSSSSLKYIAPPTVPHNAATAAMATLLAGSEESSNGSTFTDSNYNSNTDRTDTQSDTSASIIVREPPPRPVLVKKKRKNHRPRKSVTFSDNVALISAVDETHDHTDYMAYVTELLGQTKKAVNPTTSVHATQKTPAAVPVVAVAKTGYDSDFDENTSDSCTSDEMQTDKVQCNLCRKKLIEATEMYCPDCNYYMAKLQQPVT